MIVSAVNSLRLSKELRITRFMPFLCSLAVLVTLFLEMSQVD